MKQLKYFIIAALMFIAAFSYAQSPSVLSANFSVNSLPSSLGGGKFLVSGTFNDPTGKYTAANVDTSMWFNKSNDFFKIDSIYNVSGTSLTFRVVDTYSAGFISTGVAAIIGTTTNLKLPGVPATGDSNPALSTPPDYSSVMNFLISKLDEAIFNNTGGAAGTSNKVWKINSLADTTSLTTAIEADFAYINAYDAFAVKDSLQWRVIQKPGQVYEKTLLVDGSEIIVTYTNTTGLSIYAPTFDNVTFTRTGGAGQNTEGLLVLPTGFKPLSVAIHFSPAQAPGNTYYLNVRYGDIHTVPQPNELASSYTGVMGTVITKTTGGPSEGAPYLNFVHSGTPLQIGLVSITPPDGFTYTNRIKVSNYNQQAGAQGSILKLIF